MRVSDRIYTMSDSGVDIETITMVLRSEGIAEEDIRAGYDDVAQYTGLEIIRGQFYITT